LVWIKSRSAATDHAIYDSVRGATKDLGSNLATDETTQTQGLTSFDSAGFTLGTLAKVNTSAATYVAWAWDESATAGLDIVSYTGTGANRTINHALGVAPKMVIVKARTTAGADQSWPVWHTGIANTDYLLLDGSTGRVTSSTYWNSTSPTSSVFSVGTSAATNQSGDTYIAYLFAEVEGFSKFGSYTGNASLDGPFIYCGFRPKFILCKRADTTSEVWITKDSLRTTLNGTDYEIYPNLSNAQGGPYTSASGPIIDFLGNGFKVKATSTGLNASGVPYIFIAFAEAPFKYARAR
jgi:hypothetical protein